MTHWIWTPIQTRDFSVLYKEFDGISGEGSEIDVENDRKDDVVVGDLKFEEKMGQKLNLNRF